MLCPSLYSPHETNGSRLGSMDMEKILTHRSESRRHLRPPDLCIRRSTRISARLSFAVVTSRDLVLSGTWLVYVVVSFCMNDEHC